MILETSIESELALECHLYLPTVKLFAGTSGGRITTGTVTNMSLSRTVTASNGKHTSPIVEEHNPIKSYLQHNG